MHVSAFIIIIIINYLYKVGTYINSYRIKSEFKPTIS